MPKNFQDYHAQVEFIEAGLAPYAKKSLESFSATFLDGSELHKYYSDLWQTQRPRLINRTASQLERDRILYSDGTRKLTEKSHVLYNGQRRIVRNYTTHTMKMAQVARSICRGLELNGDFAEAMAIGSKIGAVPFIHAAKEPIADWVRSKVLSIDGDYAKNEPSSMRSRSEQLGLEFGENPLPSWVASLRSQAVFDKVLRYIPWAAGRNVDSPYTSGQESYWLLCTNPFTAQSQTTTFMPETMFGIWRHSRGVRPEKNSFHHKWKPAESSQAPHEIKWNHATYEACVVQYADDITWVIENLNDANSAALLNSRRSVYESLLAVLGEGIRDAILRPLSRNDSGGVYTFFISDFIAESTRILDSLGDGAHSRVALREGKAESFIGLSRESEELLNSMIQFLNTQVFTEPRVRNRAQMLRTVSVACLDLLYNGTDDILPKVIKDRATLQRWAPARINTAQELLKDPVHRIQLAIDILADMGDQEIYDFVGIQAL